MKLPEAEQAVVAREKITDYLLSETSVQGRGKNNFLRRFGFHPDRWPELAAALRVHGLRNEVVEIETTAYGIQYALTGLIETPDGRNPNIKTVWQIDYGTNYPRFITAYPDN